MSFRDVETLEWRDGFLCVAWETSGWSEPTIQKVWWPIAEMRREMAAERFTLDSPARHLSEGCYSVQTNGRLENRITVRLRDGGRTLPIATETRPYPAPKVRAGIPLEYREGGWFKRLQSGWRAA